MASHFIYSLNSCPLFVLLDGSTQNCHKSALMVACASLGSTMTMVQVLESTLRAILSAPVCHLEND